MPQIDKVEELINVKLKKVPAENKDKNIQGGNKDFLQEALSRAIDNRRKFLLLHNDEDDEEEDGWSDENN